GHDISCHGVGLLLNRPASTREDHSRMGCEQLFGCRLHIGLEVQIVDRSASKSGTEQVDIAPQSIVTIAKGSLTRAGPKGYPLRTSACTRVCRKFPSTLCFCGSLLASNAAFLAAHGCWTRLLT